MILDVFATGLEYSTAIAFRGSRALHQNRSLAGMYGVDTPAESRHRQANSQVTMLNGMPGMSRMRMFELWHAPLVASNPKQGVPRPPRSKPNSDGWQRTPSGSEYPTQHVVFETCRMLSCSSGRWTAGT